jgi:hypothetical protein
LKWIHKLKIGNHRPIRGIHLPKLLTLGIFTIDVVCEHNWMAWPVFFFNFVIFKIWWFFQEINKISWIYTRNIFFKNCQFLVLRWQKLLRKKTVDMTSSKTFVKNLCMYWFPKAVVLFFSCCNMAHYKCTNSPAWWRSFPIPKLPLQWGCTSRSLKVPT